MTDLEALADVVRAARKKRKWSQEELAERAQVTLGVVSNLERRKHKPQAANLRAILNALEIDLPTEAPPEKDEDNWREWPRDVSVVLDVMGMYLVSIPEDQREERIHTIARYIFNLARDQGAG